ncbi:hypothetical protein GGS23DRAFT_297386 [Durotheca rogersii]|uniref:uncharacterized protein n=1 Tax=Durotheca rogersii TaxID=419775 RepID=UPI00221EED73|nr:uncharacterized protein GGS23DRAFT_297386 [Durotheca rogersii]KAI5866943.1 hypothetical protein GGS23DRAFT_297386 [Durotheca rogersii]
MCDYTGIPVCMLLLAVEVGIVDGSIRRRRTICVAYLEVGSQNRQRVPSYPRGRYLRQALAHSSTRWGFSIL